MIERADDGTTFTELGTTVANATTYADASAIANISYSYRVAARNARGISAYSNTAESIILSTPFAPSSLTAEESEAAEIVLNWTDNADNEVDFVIERADDGTTFTELATTVANVTTYTDASAVANISYAYRVAARNTRGTSAYSNTAESIIIPIPAAPSSLTAEGSGAEIVLNWTDNADNEVDFVIERADDGATFTELATTVANATTYTDASAVANVNYAYRVAARNARGTSAYSNTAESIIIPTPAAPSSLTAEGSEAAEIVLNWTDNADNEVDFVIERADDGTTFTELAIVVANATTYTDASAVANISYAYRVAARNARGTSAYSNTAESIIIPIPAAPSSLTAEGSEAAEIVLNWTDNADNEVDFVIERADDGTTFATELATTVANVTSYTDASAIANISYSYKVAARNARGTSAYSNTAESIIIPIPVAPSSLTAEASEAAEIVLNWTDHADNEVDFVIERADDGTTFTTVSNNGCQCYHLCRCKCRCQY